MTLDARKFMANKGIKPQEVQALDETMLEEERKKRSDASDFDLSEEELIEKNEDNIRGEKKQK